MQKILIVTILSVAVAFGRHMPISSSSGESPERTDDELRKELDEMLIEEINSSKKEEMNTMSEKMVSTQEANEEIEIDRQKIYRVWQQFTDLLLKPSASDSVNNIVASKENADSLDHPKNKEHSYGKAKTQNTDSLDHPIYTGNNRGNSHGNAGMQNADSLDHPVYQPPGKSNTQSADSLDHPPDHALPNVQQSAERSHCITTFRINAQTGNLPYAGFSFSHGHTHRIDLLLSDGRILDGNLLSPAYRNLPYVHDLPFRTTFVDECIARTDITQVKLVAGENDGWYIASIATYVLGDDGTSVLTDNSNFFKWLDGDEASSYPYDATQHVLSLVAPPPPPTPAIETPPCAYGDEVCECTTASSKCVLGLEVDELMTFTSYQKFGVSPNDGGYIRGMQGVLYNIDEDSGVAAPHPFYASRLCGNTRNITNCTNPLYVDGSTYRMVFGVNGLIPGPTIIVHEGQDVVINVYNNMSTEGISIHWHGMHQRNSPWMDGVGQVTQCQIGPSSSYSYEFTASPSGSFWYHSHSGAQRTQGVFGTLIVRERPSKLARVKRLLQNDYSVGDFLDLPGQHSISFLDWEHESSLDTFLQLNAGLGFFPKVDLNVLPGDCSRHYSPTFSMEMGEAGAVPFYSGLLNGKGRHIDVPYSKTRLSVFTVHQRLRYRFRLIGSQGLFAYKFSIDGHKLTVVATDGYWIEPKKNVDFIIIHSGERYDFILDANQQPKNYWMRGETLEINPKGGPPYRSLGHSAEGILQYIEPGHVEKTIESTSYEDIKLSSLEIVCSNTNPCFAVNCPFENFHPSYYTTCINVDQLRLLEDTQPSELPHAYPSADCPNNECLHFLNFNFEGDTESSSINGRNFILPPVPPVTQQVEYEKQGLQCDLNADCNPSDMACKCTHVISTPYNKTVQIVLSALGVYDNAHPIHLHGHTFFVVKVGFPRYDQSTGFIAKKDGPVCDGNVTQVSDQNEDIQCEDRNLCGDSQCPVDGCKPNRCTQPSWRNGVSPPLTIDSRTIRKDTVMLPAGGYVVINIVSDNPGYWFLHCHIEIHQLEGMALVLNEAPLEQSSFQLPDGLNTCGSYNVDYTR